MNDKDRLILQILEDLTNEAATLWTWVSDDGDDGDEQCLATEVRKHLAQLSNLLTSDGKGEA